MHPTIYTGTDEDIELSLFEADGVTPLVTTGWVVHVHLKALPDAEPMLALSSANPAEVSEVDAGAGLWVVHISRDAGLPQGDATFAIFGETDDDPAKLRPLGEHPVTIRPGWTAA